LRVFRDDTSLSATPQLWPSIEQALSQSRYFLLLSSPEAAASPWVAKEAEYWLANKRTDTLFIGVTDGALDWDGAANLLSQEVREQRRTLSVSAAVLLLLLAISAATAGIIAREQQQLRAEKNFAAAKDTVDSLTFNIA
jgi:hypothetical protein